MADGYKILYQGQLATSAATIYTVTAGKEAIIGNIKIVNEGTVASSWQLFIGGTAASNAITSPTWMLNPGEMEEWDGKLGLAAANTIAGVAAVASSLTCTILGLEF